MIYAQKTPSNICIRAYGSMEQTTNPPPAVDRRELVLQRLRQLSPRETEMCILHFVEGRSQTQIAEWLGITVQMVQRHISRAVLKVPELLPLRTKGVEKPPRPRVYHLSQISRAESCDPSEL